MRGIGTAVQASSLTRLNKASCVRACACVCLASNKVELRHPIPTEGTSVRTGLRCTTLELLLHAYTHTHTQSKTTAFDWCLILNSPTLPTIFSVACVSGMV